MRGPDEQTSDMFSYLSPEQRVRPDHPLRAIRAMTDEVLRALSPRFPRMYSDIGRPSIPPEQLLRALLLQALYTVRSERLLMEEIDYSILFRWFIGLSLDEPIWSPTTFSKNRDRLLTGDIASAFFDAVLGQAREAALLSDEHFTVDGTLLEAWASLKSFSGRTPARRRRPTIPAIRRSTFMARRGRTTRTPRPPIPTRSSREGSGQGGQAGVSGTRAARQSPWPGEQRLRDGRDRHGRAEAALMLLGCARRAKTVGGDKGYDVASFVAAVRDLGITPHVAQKVRGSAMPAELTANPGYAVSQRKRKLIEQVFGWMKTVGGLRKLRHRGGELVDWIVTFTAAAYNLIRLRTLLARA